MAGVAKWFDFRKVVGWNLEDRLTFYNYARTNAIWLLTFGHHQPFFLCWTYLCIVTLQQIAEIAKVTKTHSWGVEHLSQSYETIDKVFLTCNWNIQIGFSFYIDVFMKVIITIWRYLNMLGLFRHTPSSVNLAKIVSKVMNLQIELKNVSEELDMVKNEMEDRLRAWRSWPRLMRAAYRARRNGEDHPVVGRVIQDHCLQIGEDTLTALFVLPNMIYMIYCLWHFVTWWGLWLCLHVFTIVILMTRRQCASPAGKVLDSDRYHAHR